MLFNQPKVKIMSNRQLGLQHGLQHGLPRFPPDEQLVDPRFMVLGTFPGNVSRNIDNWYYMEDYNQFWPMMRIKYNLTLDTIEEQQQFLIDNGIVLWDVIAECETDGSIDENLDLDTARWNDEEIENFLILHPGVKVIFNGKNKKVAGPIFKGVEKRLVSLNITPKKLYSTSRRNLSYFEEGAAGYEEWMRAFDIENQ